MTELNCNGDKSSPFYRPFWVGNVPYRCILLREVLWVPSDHCYTTTNSFLQKEMPKRQAVSQSSWLLERDMPHRLSRRLTNVETQLQTPLDWRLLRANYVDFRPHKMIPLTTLFNIFIWFPDSFSATPIFKILYVFLVSFQASLHTHLIVRATWLQIWK
jgi:hypothetical protein